MPAIPSGSGSTGNPQGGSVNVFESVRLKHGMEGIAPFTIAKDLHVLPG